MKSVSKREEGERGRRENKVGEGRRREEGKKRRREGAEERKDIHMRGRNIKRHLKDEKAQRND